MLEKRIEEKLRIKVKQLGGKAYKFVSPGNAGVPDRLVVLPGGRIGFAELKRPGGTTRKLQDRQIAFLRKLGFVVEVVNSEEDIENFMKEMRAKENGKTNI